MELFFISVLIGIIVFFICNIFEYMVLGDRGRNKQLTNYYRYIKGEVESETKKKSKSKNSSKMIEMSRKTYIKYAIPACIFIFIIMYISSKSIILAFIISLLGIFYPTTIIKNRIKKRNDIINLQFRDALNSIVSSLKAGLSINSALIKCSDDLAMLYSSVKDKPILEEFLKIKSDLNMGMSVDDTLRSFMKKMKIEDVDDFVNSVIIVRQKGGNLVEVMTSVIKMINDKFEIRREIETLTTSKKMEAKVMSILPIFVITMLSLFSFNYVKPLYESSVGKILIVIGFASLVINYFIAKKIVDIKL